MTTDEEHAKAVYEALSVLNRTISDAVQIAKLRVDVRCIEACAVGAEAGWPMIAAQVSKPLKGLT